MKFDFFKQAVRVVTACVLVTFFAVPQNLAAQAVTAAHVVSPADLQKEVLAVLPEVHRQLFLDHLALVADACLAAAQNSPRKRA